MTDCPLCKGNFRRLVRHLSRAGKTFKIASRTLPPNGDLIQIRTKRHKNWRDGILLEGKDGKIYWSYWEKSGIRLRGVSPGDQWRQFPSEHTVVVQEYEEAAQ